MAISVISPSRIRAVCSSVPERRFDNLKDSTSFSPEEVDKVVKMAGVRSRHIASDKLCSSDLCAAAAKQVMESLQWDPQSVDALIFVSQSPDYFLPSTACLLQHWLGMSEACATFDVGLGCSGYPYGLWLAGMMLSGGGLKRVLVLHGDTPARFADHGDRSVALLFGDAGSATALSRFTIEMPPEAPVVTNYRSRVVTISPDGSRVAYASALGGDRTIYVRPVDELQAIELRGTEGSGTAPFFSPDGEFIGFAGESDGQTLKRVPALGGTPVTIASLDSQPFGMEWATDDTILFSAGPRRGLLRIPAVGGEVEELTTVDVGEAWHEHATLLPDGDTILFTISYRSGEEPQLARLSLRSREVTRLPLNGSDPIYSPTGHIVYVVSDGTLRAVGFDLDRLELTSTNPVPVLENVNTGFGRRTGNFGLAANGSLVYLSGDSQAAQRTLVWVDREGREELIGAEPGDHRGLRLAPDGERAALVMRDGDGNVDVLIYDLARDISTRFTFDPANDSYPVWSPDGERVVFGSTREGISSLFWKAADGSGEAERLTTSTRNEFSGSWSSDGTTLVYTERSPETGLDIVVLAVDDERVSETLIETEFSDTFPNISPDGRWLVYASNESGQFEIYVRPFPNVSTGKWQVSRGGGLKPLWAPDGRELFYRRPDDLAMMVAPIETEPTFSPGNPTVLFEATNFPVPAGPRRFDIAPDGQRFLMTKEGEATSEDATPSQINIVLNWREELKRLVPVP